MKVIVTRPSPDAERFAAELRRIGADPALSPAMAILRREGAIDLEGAFALAFTSANGVRAFAALSGVRDLPVFAVGPATAEAARDAGFASVSTAEGDVESLAALISQSKPAGMVLHLAGGERAGDLVEALVRKGVKARRAVIYDAVEIEDLAPGAKAILADAGEKPAVVFFSPRSARLFLAQAARAALSDRLKGCLALCLSDDIAAAIRAEDWSAIRVASGRSGDAMLRLVAEAISERNGRTDAPR